MATIGLDKLFYSKITEGENGDETYETPAQLAKAMTAELSVELAEATLYADCLLYTSLKGWELFFKGSKTGSYLTIEEREGGTVPVVIWEVTATDEAALDRYEGFPNFYYKKDIKLRYKGIRTGKRRTVAAFAYIMHEDRPVGIPSNLYMRTCLEGYDTFYFDKNILIDAYDKCREVCGYEV